jgi:hypothetical protein
MEQTYKGMTTTLSQEELNEIYKECSEIGAREAHNFIEERRSAYKTVKTEG